MELELKKFIKDLKLIEESMYKSIIDNTYPTDEKLLKSLNRFHENIIFCRSLTAFSSSKNLDNFVSINGLESDISNLIVQINTFNNQEKKLSDSTNNKATFRDSAQKIITLKAMVKTLLKEGIEKYKDSEIFKPQVIDIAEIILHLDEAKKALIGNISIEPSTKENLIQYIDEAKIELKKTNPLYRNIIGGLVIVASILSGIADAPDAFESVNKAYHSIVGKPFSGSPSTTETIYQVDPIKLEAKVYTETSAV